MESEHDWTKDIPNVSDEWDKLREKLENTEQARAFEEKRGDDHLDAFNAAAAELSKLRAENARLQRENAISKPCIVALEECEAKLTDAVDACISDAVEIGRLKAENARLREAIEEHLEARRRVGGTCRTDATLAAALNGQRSELRERAEAIAELAEESEPYIAQRLRDALKGKGT